MKNDTLMKIVLVTLSVVFLVGTTLLFYPVKNIYGIFLSYSPIAQNKTRSFIPGDANGDGKVDGKDYSVILNNMGKTTQNGESDGDFNNDGVVDNVDLQILLQHYSI